MLEKKGFHDNTHGGDLQKMSTLIGCSSQDIIDFSVNIHCEGTPDFIRSALFQAMEHIEAYPSPNAEELKILASKYYEKYKLEAEQFVFGNGSNELIHALSRVLKKDGYSKVYIVEPAFSEYALGAEKAGLEIERLWYSQEEQGFIRQDNFLDFESSLEKLEAHSAIFFANPANPSALFLEVDTLLKYIHARQDLLWIIDEAFIEYVGEESLYSLLPQLPDNAIILRSLTKFHSVPGVRLGYLVSNTIIARKIQEELPAWNINSFAICAVQAIFEEAQEAEKNKQGYAKNARTKNAENREHLINILNNIEGLTLLPSVTNYILLRLDKACKDLKNILLKEYKIAIRDCSNYHGLEDYTWFRVAVRKKEDNEILANALEEILSSKNKIDHKIRGKVSKKTPALMIQGTSSDAGKSIIAAAYCRIFKQDGYRVAPFKSQNMSLNSGVTGNGEEMGRAQIVQAQAAGLDPCSRMNPVLLKPNSDKGSQLIVRGKALGHFNVIEYIKKKKDIWQIVKDTYNELSQENDIIVLEGAGSPGEINLKSHDIVNMKMAKHAKASVLLVGDIDRGGVYASLLGTYMTFDTEERKLLAGYLINKFRGDASLLETAHDYMLKYTNKPVLGVIPLIKNLGVPDEDMAGFSWTESHDYSEVATGIVDIAVIMLHHVSNYTDITPLAQESDIRVRAVRTTHEFGNPHVVIIPGSKSVVADLEELHKNGLAQKILQHARDKKWIFGICGGLQILGREILDPYAVETDKARVKGLNILDISTQFEKVKTLIRISKAQTPLNVCTQGYEIHHGITKHGKDVLPLFLRDDKEYSSEEERICGYVHKKCWATYLHGVFDDDIFRRAWIDYIRVDLGFEPKGKVENYYDLEKSLDRLAQTVREHSDMEKIYKNLGIK